MQASRILSLLLFAEPDPVGLVAMGLFLLAAALVAKRRRDAKIKKFFAPDKLIARWWKKADARSDAAWKTANMAAAERMAEEERSHVAVDN
jgi:hypothetical protein